MSNGFGSYVFLSWLRRGLSTGLTTPDQATLGHPRVSLPLQVLSSKMAGGLTTAQTPIAVSGLALYGPGEVTGFDPRVVARTWPRADTSDAEPNFFPFVELVPADLPWMYTPAAANAQDRVRPWLCAVVLASGEFTIDRTSAGVLAVTIDKAAPLPLLSQGWAWAHVQVAGPSSLNPTTAADVATVIDLMANRPAQIVARLVCPRRLDPRTQYTAFVVPSFQRGVEAALGAPPDDTVDGLRPAWSDAEAPWRAAPLQLPAYYSWRFSTGDGGDFLSLVRRLQKNPMPTTVGTRPMDVGDPGGGLPGAAPSGGNTLGLEGALRVPDSSAPPAGWNTVPLGAPSGTPWSPSDRQAWTNALVQLMQSTSPVQVAVPLYARWHAERTSLNPTLSAQTWFDDLNIDPRTRVAAAAGVAIVQSQQQQMMASAWRQGAGVREINNELRHAQLARDVSSRLYQRHVVPLTAQTAVLVTSPIHRRVRYVNTDCVTGQSATHSIAAWIDRTPLPHGFFDPQWRRVSRPWGGALGRRATMLRRLDMPLVDRLMNRSLMLAAPPPRSAALSVLANAGFDPARILTALAGVNGPSTMPPANYCGSKLPVAPPLTSDNQGTKWSGFVAALGQVAATLATPPAAAPITCPLDSKGLAAAAVGAIDPQATVPAAYAGRLQISSSAWRGADALGPVYIAPQYPQPMFEPLRALGQDWVLPGLDQVPPNTLSLLETNDRFVEAYMAGLNFELGRELLWNGFPTDQRGSYFRQFWDHRSAVTIGGQIPDSDARWDIDLLTRWSKPLGDNPNPNGIGTGSVVLLIRGDLFRRYPNAQVYAVRALIGASGRTFPDPDSQPPPTEQQPLFSGTLQPDVTFLGFDLTPDEARGTTTDPNDPGWYFVLQEHAAEPRVGLEPALPSDIGKTVTSWADMNWGSLAKDETTLDAMTYVDLDATLPDTSGAPLGLAWHATLASGQTGATAADIASITLREPTRVAIAADDLLPPNPQG